MIKLSRDQNPTGFDGEQATFLKKVLADIYDELNYAGGINPPVRNMLANPAHRHWWEFTSSTATTALWGALVHLVTASGCTVTGERIANTFDLPTTSPYVMKVTNTITSGAGSAFTRFCAEGAKRFAGKKITFTFYAKTDIAKADLYIKVGMSNSAGAYIYCDDARWKNTGIETVSISDAFQQYSVTVTIPEITGVTYLNDFIFFDVYQSGEKPGHRAGAIWYGPCGIYQAASKVPYFDESPSEEINFLMRYYECSWFDFWGSLYTGAFVTSIDVNGNGNHYTYIPYRSIKRYATALAAILNDQTFAVNNARVFSNNYNGTATVVCFSEGAVSPFGLKFHSYTYGAGLPALICFHFYADARMR